MRTALDPLGQSGTSLYRCCNPVLLRWGQNWETSNTPTRRSTVKIQTVHSNSR